MVRDSLGEVDVPEGVRYGPQTQRAVENFPISGRPLDRRLIAALGLVKQHAALVNARLEAVAAVDGPTGAAIAAAAAEVATGQWDDEFPIDVFQTGSGTSSNMNANEVIASLASERLGRSVHPNDEVNASQSSNDVVPSAVHLAAALAVRDELLPALAVLHRSLRSKAKELEAVVKAGRTHLMDATPVTLGQEFGGYAAQVDAGRARLERTLTVVCELALGGTAVGTGINAPRGFAPAVIEGLVEATGLPLVEAPDHFAAQGARDALVELSGQLRVVAVSLTKIANDIRLMASGPNSGLAEIRLPELQPGSSIMPGKVNPVMCEVVTQVAAQVIGNDAAVGFAGSQGTFELNVYIPVMARNVLESIELLTNAVVVFARKGVDGIEADEERCRAYAEASPAIVTALNTRIGYERAAQLARRAVAERRSLKELVVAEGVLSQSEADRILDPLALTEGG